MKKLIVIVALFVALLTHAQKPTIARNDYDKWETRASGPQLSADGSYVVYFIADSGKKEETLIALNTDNRWKKTLPGMRSPAVVTDENIAVFRNGNDTLFLLQLGTERMERIANVDSFSYEQRRQLLAYTTTDTPNTLVIRDLAQGGEQAFSGVIDYFFSCDGRHLYTTRKGDFEGKTLALTCTDLQTGAYRTIWEGTDLTAKTTGPLEGQLAIIGKRQGAGNTTLWYHQPDFKVAREISLPNNTLAIDTVAPRFNAAGDRLFYYLAPSEQPDDDTHRRVHIWTYSDSLYQREVLLERGEHRNALAMCTLPSNSAVQLTDLNEYVIGNMDGDWLLIKKRFKTNRFWEDSMQSTIAVYDLNLHSRTALPRMLLHYDMDPVISPTGGYVVNYSPNDSAYFAYEIRTGTCRNITTGLATKIYDDQIDRLYPRPFGIAGWVTDENAILLYDQYDIWMVDLQGTEPGRCLTNGFGRKHQLIFSRLEPDVANGSVPKGFSGHISAFSRVDKTNGFWRLNWEADPEICTMGPYVYAVGRVNTYGFEFPKGMVPIKAKRADRYLVQRESATEHPNLYLTKTFRSFKKLTNFAPEKQFNWLTAELVEWVMADGKRSQGILYKPEDFDPHMKYPVLFHYYQRKSDKLNEYLIPNISTAALDIPTYVSNGYLVFVPDIYYTWGKGNGHGALNAVESAATHLSQFSWVDAERMGLQAHSHGGFQTNYIITHSNRFAAACQVAGTSNAISSYGQLTGYGRSRQPGGEIGFQGVGLGIGKTPWTATDLYVQNSPVLQLDKVTTPLLMIHGDKDTAVPFEQSIELFTGLRRAGKKAWFLEYPGAGHFLQDDQAEDFTVRMRQFFDHFLMGRPIPTWMD